mgnify:CR=1 FL=1
MVRSYGRKEPAGITHPNLPPTDINDIYFQARDEWREAYPADKRPESVLLKDTAFKAFIERRMKEMQAQLRARGIEVLY